MDFCKERKAEVFDFGRHIKKVRVVAWLDEKEAEKLPGPFKVILFQRNLWKTRTCALCDFSSFEAARKEERQAGEVPPPRNRDG
jgi:hypothetical protein